MNGAKRSGAKKRRPRKRGKRPPLVDDGNHREINENAPKRHFANYTNRLRRYRRSFREKLQNQLRRRIPANQATISIDAMKHIWRRHGCYQNAKRERTRKKNKGKMPSYFRNHRALVYSVAATILSPNWTRTAIQTNRRLQRPKLGVPAHSRPLLGARRPHPTRRFYFKMFNDHIGYSGRGYGSRGANAVADDLECKCCCVLLDGKCLVTAFPILTLDADNQGIGAKDQRDDIVDGSTFGSGSEISSSDSVELDEGLGTHVESETVLSEDSSEDKTVPEAKAEDDRDGQGN